MKKYASLNILIAVFIFSANVTLGGIMPLNTMYSSLQAGKQDTVKYLRENIVARKARFQHKELNVMLKELNLSVKSYVFQFGKKPGDPPRSITLLFDDSKTTSNKSAHHRQIAMLNVHFENEISRTQLLQLFSKSHGEWLPAEQAFFGKMVVKDVEGLRTDKN